jgi:nucleotide-binding universal stress UspA family protein
MNAIRTIVVAVDFSESSGAALDYAIDLAKTLDARLHLVHAYEAPLLEMAPYDFAFPQSVWDDVKKAAGEQLAKWRDRVSAAGVGVQTHLTHALPSDAITRVAEEVSADLIVIGTRGHTGLKHVLLGSVAERTVRTARCPVLTVKRPD